MLTVSLARAWFSPVLELHFLSQ